MVTSQEILTDAQSIQHGPLSSNIEEDKLHVPPDSYYWVVLQLELSPVGCKSVYSEPIRTRAAVSPDPPVISLKVEGLHERKRLEERICELSNKRDRFAHDHNCDIYESLKESLTTVTFESKIANEQLSYILRRNPPGSSNKWTKI